MTTLNYFSLIHDDAQMNNKLQSSLSGGEQNPFGFFATDALHFVANYRAAIQNSRLLSAGSSPCDVVRSHIKLATLQFSNGDHSTAADHIIQVSKLKVQVRRREIEI